jgi:hypothetical protein
MPQVVRGAARIGNAPLQFTLLALAAALQACGQRQRFASDRFAVSGTTLPGASSSRDGVPLIAGLAVERDEGETIDQGAPTSFAVNVMPHWLVWWARTLCWSGGAGLTLEVRPSLRGWDL